MYNAGKIFLGLGVFAVLVTAPAWYGAAHGKGSPPELAKPVEGTDCVEPKAFMRAKHMELLDSWRDAAVRRAERVYVSSDGKHHQISLTGTCLRCHNEPEKFCNRCHEYAGVDVYCWDCHQQKKRS
jgi:[DsrC]-trisulfide reductase subunit J